MNSPQTAPTLGLRRIEAVVIGASAGAIEALSAILPKLPRNYPVPVMVVVHLPPDRQSIIANLFAVKSAIAVREAEDKEPLNAGTVYFAPPDYHLLVEHDHRLSLSSEEPVHYSRPAVDVLLETAADAFGPGLVAVILSGANSDGANGLRAVCNAGGVGLVQRPDLAQAAIMPQSALDACPTAEALTLQEIAARLLEVASPR